jgi:LPS O-antigen subunit length determinant protein (WzzB/FepE family)
LHKSKGVYVIKLLEAIFRRFFLLMLILFVPIIIGVGIGYILPPSYQATTTIWALQPYQVINTGGVGSNLPVTPAGTQTAALTEQLKSTAFDVAVGESTDLKSTFTAQALENAQTLNNAYVADISKNVIVTSSGTNLYQITYTNNDPRIAIQVVKAVIKQFQIQGQQFSMQTVPGQTYTIIEAQRLLQADQAQLIKAQSDAAAALKDETAYLAAHFGATLLDPQYATLDAQRIQTQTTVTNLQATIATLNQQIAASQGASLFKILDPPGVPAAGSRSKNLLTTGSIGAGVGFVVCILYILILVRRDRAFYTALDVQKASSYPVLMQVPDLMQLPNLPNAAKELVLSGTMK